MKSVRRDVQELFDCLNDRSDDVWMAHVDFCNKYRDKKRVAIAERRAAMDPEERKRKNRETVAAWKLANPERWAAIQAQYEEKRARKRNNGIPKST